MSEPFVSYSINHEDVLFRRFFPGKIDGFYVDVGAEHPRLGNDFLGLYLLGWTGINIEPNPQFFAMLERERPRDRNMQLALSDIAGQEVTFFEVEGTGLSTCDKKQANACAAEGYTVTQHELRTSTLNSVLDEIRPKHIDILKVDVEGLEEAVLLGNDWNAYRPSVIMVEATYPQTSERRPTNIRKILEAVGYRHFHFDNLNDFYADNSFAIPPGAILPPNVFDNFVDWNLYESRNENTVLKASFADAEAYARSLEKSEQRAQSSARFTRQVAIAAILNRSDELDGMCANGAPAQNLERPERESLMRETGELPDTQTDQDIPIDVRLEMTTVRLQALSEETTRLENRLQDLLHDNRRLLESNSQLQGENMSLRRALTPNQAIQEELVLVRNRLDTCLKTVDATLRAGFGTQLETLVHMQTIRDNDASNMLRAVYNSTSWRLTRPLRALVGLLKR